MKLGRSRFAVVILWFSIFSIAGWSQQDEEARFFRRVPLGAETFELRPENSHDRTVFYLIASAESPAFSGMHRIRRNERCKLLTSHGDEVRFYPEHVRFRVTASSREKLIDSEPYPTTTRVAANEFFLNLQFRLVIFHGLQQTSIVPVSIENIGMPANVPYNERVYRMNVDLIRIPIEDRIVLEVLTPNGDRICKFHLDLL